MENTQVLPTQMSTCGTLVGYLVNFQYTIFFLPLTLLPSRVQMCYPKDKSTQLNKGNGVEKSANNVTWGCKKRPPSYLSMVFKGRICSDEGPLRSSSSTNVSEDVP